MRTRYEPAHDLGRGAPDRRHVAAPAEQFTLSIDAADGRRGTLSMTWAPFRWTAPIEGDAGEA